MILYQLLVLLLTRYKGLGVSLHLFDGGARVGINVLHGFHGLQHQLELCHGDSHGLVVYG